LSDQFANGVILPEAQLSFNIDKQTGWYVIIRAMNKNAHSKAELTRQRIVESAAQLFHQQGYHNTGLQQILNSAGVTKGAFYFHFADKKSVALAALGFYQQLFEQHFAAPLKDQTLSPWQRIEGFHLAVKQVFGGDMGMVGCPMGNLSLEMAGQEPEIQKALEQSFTGLVDRFTDCIQQGLDDGQFAAQKDARFLAEFLLNSWEGAVLRMKAAQSLEPLDNWFESMALLLQVKP